jgi:hypothetical protein
MRFALAIMASAGLSLMAGSARAHEVYQATPLATFPSNLTPNNLLAFNNGAVYGVAYDYTDTSDSDPSVTTWVYRVSDKGVITRPCPGQKGGTGESVAFDSHGTGYTVGVKGILQFSDKAGCKLIAGFDADLDPQSVNGMLAVAPSGTVFGTTRTGKLFFVDFAHGTTRAIQTLKVPTDGFLTGAAADPAHEGLLYGTIVSSNAAGVTQTQLFADQVAGQYKPLDLFAQNFHADVLTFGSQGRLLAADVGGSYLLSPTGKILSSTLPVQDFPLAVAGNHLLYSYQTTTVIPPVPPSRMPVVKINTYIGQANLDGTSPQSLMDTTSFGSATSGIAQDPHGNLYQVMVGATGPHLLVKAVASSL